MVKIRIIIVGLMSLMARVFIASAVANSFPNSLLALIALTVWVFFPTWNLFQAIYWDIRYMKQQKDKSRGKSK